MVTLQREKALPQLGRMTPFVEHLSLTMFDAGARPIVIATRVPERIGYNVLLRWS